MNARIGHVVDARDTRPAFFIAYRRFSSVRPESVRVQADSVDHAVAALREHIGNDQYAVKSITAL